MGRRKKNPRSDIIPNNKFSIEHKIFFKKEDLGKNNRIKEIIPLLLFEENPLRLERENVNRGLDELIREEMNRRIPRGENRPLPLSQDLSNPKGAFFFSGLHSYAVKGVDSRELTVHGERVVLKDYNSIHFAPEERISLNPSKMTESLASGIQGVVEMINAIDQGRFEAAPVFVGTTNINMALIAQRLGFVIVDQCRTPDGNINKNLRSFTVVGKLDDIRARVGEYKRAGVAQKLEQRNQRLQARPKLIPVGA